MGLSGALLGISYTKSDVSINISNINNNNNNSNNNNKEREREGERERDLGELFFLNICNVFINKVLRSNTRLFII
jgi:hypothetical protein